MLPVDRAPDFENLLKVLRREVPNRPTLFEFYHNEPLYRRMAGLEVCALDDELATARIWIHAFGNMGYDYVTLMSMHLGALEFPTAEHAQANTVSLNAGAIVTDRASFEAYPWPDPAQSDYSILERIAPELPDGMKCIVAGPCGVLENVMAIVGFENLCLMLADDPDLAQAIFDAVGSRLVTYYERVLTYETVGAIYGNDDWGFKTQTMLAPEQMRRYVFPWHERIVAAAHAAGKPAILHSCGNLETVMDDVIDGIGYDAKHSFEDNILPVEDVYETYGDRIAVVGGIDVDYLVQADPHAIADRSAAMLQRTADRGGYALGSGNSIPEYVPDQSFFAMISPAIEEAIF